jgi:hypothetical protein
MEDLPMTPTPNNEPQTSSPDEFSKPPTQSELVRFTLNIPTDRFFIPTRVAHVMGKDAIMYLRGEARDYMRIHLRDRMLYDIGKQFDMLYDEGWLVESEEA